MTRTGKIAEYRQKQPIAELERKANKARSRSSLWSQEEIDLIHVEARKLRKELG